jgi:hypothetical protein
VNDVSEDAYDDMAAPIEVDVPEQRDIRLINARKYLERQAVP